MSQELHEYIKQSRAQGHSDESIAAELKKSGWSPLDIDQALRKSTSTTSSSTDSLMPAAEQPNQQLPGTIELIKETIQQFQKHLGLYVGLSAIGSVIAAPFAFITAGMAQDQIGAWLFTTLTNFSTPLLVASVAWILLVLFLQVLSYTSLLSAITQEGEQSFPAALRSGLRLVLPIIWVSILTGLIVFGGFLLLVIPGIILSVATMFTLYVRVQENKRGLRSIVESGYLVKGYGWAIFGRLLLTTLMWYALVVPFAIAVEMFLPDTLIAAITLIFNIIFGPLLLIWPYRVYHHLRARKGEASAEIVTKRTRRYHQLLGLGITIMILGLLVFPFIAVFALGGTRVKARDSKRISDVKRIQTAVEIYFADQETYPIELVPVLLGVGANDMLTNAGFEDDLAPSGETVYMPRVPSDLPNTTSGYAYVSDGTTYQIFFQLEGDNNYKNLGKGDHVATPEGMR